MKTKLSVEALESRDMMAIAVLDPEIRNLYNLGMRDGRITREEMVSLFQSSTDGGQVNATETRDLRNILLEGRMGGDVKSLGSNLMDAKPTADNMNQLLDKWFFGKDRPSLGGYSNVSYQYVKGSLFVNGASSADMRQGMVGDCYLIASLGALADKNNSAINTMFRDNMDDTWSVRFYKIDGTRYIEDWVTVDRYLPTNSVGRSVFQNFGGSASDSRNELWAALAEKAYVQWARGNSWQNMNGGWPYIALSEITGRPTSNTFDMSTVENRMIPAVLRGDTVVVYRYMNAARTQAHAYYIQSYSNGVFLLKNPWGYADLTLTVAEVKSQCYGFAVATRVSSATIGALPPVRVVSPKV